MQEGNAFTLPLKVIYLRKDEIDKISNKKGATFDGHVIIFFFKINKDHVLNMY